MQRQEDQEFKVIFWLYSEFKASHLVRDGFKGLVERSGKAERDQELT